MSEQVSGDLSAMRTISNNLQGLSTGIQPPYDIQDAAEQMRSSNFAESALLAASVLGMSGGLNTWTQGLTGTLAHHAASWNRTAGTLESDDNEGKARADHVVAGEVDRIDTDTRKNPQAPLARVLPDSAHHPLVRVDADGHQLGADNQIASPTDPAQQVDLNSPN